MTVYSPLEQFEVVPVLFNLTNLSITALLLVFVLLVIFLGSSGTGLVALTTWNTALVALAHFFYSMVRDQIGAQGRQYFGVIFTIFVCVLGFNLLGMIPYSFTLTSHLVITLGLSFPVFFAMTGEAFVRHGFSFFSFFLPAGAPLGLIPVLPVIEIISYIARLFSLAIRLAANMLAGHCLLKIIATTTFQFICGGILFAVAAVIPFALLYVFTVLEIGIAFLQAYVFSLLVCCYLHDAIELH